MPTLTLIDGSGFIFRAFHAIPHLSTTKGVPTNAVYGFTTMLLKSLREHAPTHVALVFDASRKSFRTDARPLLQGQPPGRAGGSGAPVPARPRGGAGARRAGARGGRASRPTTSSPRWRGAPATRDSRSSSSPGTRTSRSWSARGSSSTTPWPRPPARGGWTRTPEVEKKLGVRPDQVVELMALTGDKVDNVPGVPGVGEVTAAALVRHFGTVEALLARPEEIPQAVARGGAKLKEKIVAHADRIRLNRDAGDPEGGPALAERPADLARRPVNVERARAALQRARVRAPAARPARAGPGARPAGHPGRRPRASPSTRPSPRRARWPARSGCRAAFSSPAPADRPACRPGLRGGAAERCYVPLRHRYLGAPTPLRRPGGGRRAPPAPRGPRSRGPRPRPQVGDPRAPPPRAARLPARGLDTELASRLLLPSRREHALADVARERLGIELPPAPAERREGRRRSRHLPGRGDARPTPAPRRPCSPAWRRRSRAALDDGGARPAPRRGGTAARAGARRDGAGRHRGRLGGHGRDERRVRRGHAATWRRASTPPPAAPSTSPPPASSPRCSSWSSGSRW